MPTGICELEALRLANIEERNRMLKELFDDKDEFSLIQKNSTPRTVASRGKQSCRGSKLPKKVLVTRKSPPRTRSGGSSKTSKRLVGNLSELDEEEDEPVRKRRTPKARKVSHRRYNGIGRALPRPQLNPEDVTDEMLSAIAMCSSEKVYSGYGTTCHQCRQKTLDTKTVCRGPNCFGVKGQFCGPCLHGRYGESVAVALRDPEWMCLSCRNECNCSFCMPKKRKRPTGIMLPEARKHGFTNVRDYLKSVVDSNDDDDMVDSNDDDDAVDSNDDVVEDSDDQVDRDDELEEKVRNHSEGGAHEMVIKDAIVLLKKISN